MKNDTDEVKKEVPEKDAKKRLPRNRKTGPRFEWGEVDNVTQEDMLLPAKKKKNRRHIDHVESTLTVGGSEVDPYAIIPPQSGAPSLKVKEDPSIPSYGRMMEDEEDEFSIFLRNAEKADEREREKEAAKKERAAKRVNAGEEKQVKKNPPKSEKDRPARSKSQKPNTAETSQKQEKKEPISCGSKSASGMKSADKPSRSAVKGNPLADFRNRIDEVREYGLHRIEQIGFSESEKEEFLSSLSVVERMLGLIDILLHSPACAGPESEAFQGRSVKKEYQSEDLSAKKNVSEPEKKSEKKSARPVRESAAKTDTHTAERRSAFVVSEKETRDSASLNKIRENWTFGDVKLSDAMLAMLSEANYEKPSPIQSGTIPQILAGKDIMGQSQTGSGKTAAFMIPIIERVEGCEPGDDPVALIVVPTRELAVQIRDETVKLAHNREIAVVACYGGKPIADQIKKMRGGTDIVIGTPGRILDLAKRSALSLASLKWVVLDEADRMLDIGFRPDIERILRQTPRDRQTLLFSATLADPVVRLAQRYMTDPETCDFSEKDIAADTIEQYYITVDRNRKFEALVRLLRRENPQQAIVFCRTKRGVDKLGRGLVGEFKEWKISAIHGDLTQSSRDSIMRSFRSGGIKILVATDVVGRGIDVSGISHIINYDIPEFCDDYVHRVGRTGRMGREGVAFTLVTTEEGNELTRIEMRINRLLQRTELDGFEAFTRPDDAGNSDEPKEPKAVFGKPLRRVRRAL